MPAGMNSGAYYRRYLVFLLATILAFNSLDITATGLVLPSIKIAFHLTDTQLGVLTGIAFSLFYSTAGIPIGRWADRGDRVAIIALTAALRGVMVMSISAVGSFATLLIVRIGVAVGEAGCVPAAYSLIADYFAREDRPRAVANYLLGGAFSIILGYLAAGWLSDNFGWRATFLCLGIPSLVIAPLAWCTLREPRRAKRDGESRAITDVDSTGVLQVIRALWENKTFRYLLAVISVNALFGTGIAAWQPSFFVRSYGLKTEQLGLYFALIYGVGTTIGLYSGGVLASRYAPRRERLQLMTFAFFNAGFGVISAFIYLTRDPSVSTALLSLAVIGGSIQSGPVFAAIQTVVPERMRGICISIIYLFANLVGGGVGPLLVGALSDALHPSFGAESLRYALLAMCPGYLPAGWLLWRAAQSVAADTEAAGVNTGGRSALSCASP